MSEHAYFVKKSAGSGQWLYRPACSCGWSGAQVSVEKLAAAEAFGHATGKSPEWPEKKPKPVEPGDPLFDPAPYLTKRR